jgi:hypothetical protein
MLGSRCRAANKLDERWFRHEAMEFPAVARFATYNVAWSTPEGQAGRGVRWLDKAIAAGFDNVRPAHGVTTTSTRTARPAHGEGRGADAGEGEERTGRCEVFARPSKQEHARVVAGARARRAQLSDRYSPVPWSDKYEEVVSSGAQKGKKWRLGADFWTRLDTSIGLQFGAVAVPAGYYYLTLEQRDADTYVLALHDAAAVKKLKTDAFLSEKLKGGIEVTMQHKKTDEIAKELAIAIEMKAGSKTEGTVTIHFGGHALAAPFTAKFE